MKFEELSHAELIKEIELRDEEIKRLHIKNKMLVETLDEAITEYEYASQYKGEYLRKKHNDEEIAKELREALKNCGKS